MKTPKTDGQKFKALKADLANAPAADAREVFEYLANDAMMDGKPMEYRVEWVIKLAQRFAANPAQTRVGDIMKLLRQEAAACQKHDAATDALRKLDEECAAIEDSIEAALSKPASGSRGSPLVRSRPLLGPEAPRPAVPPHRAAATTAAEAPESEKQADNQ